MKRVLSVCTRVAAEPGSEDDEYERVWRRPEGERIHSRICGDYALIVLRGCAFFEEICAGHIDFAINSLREEVLRELTRYGADSCDVVLAVHAGTAEPESPPESLYWIEFFNRLSVIDLTPHRCRSVGVYSHSHAIYRNLPPLPLSNTDEERILTIEQIFTGATELPPVSTHAVPELTSELRYLDGAKATSSAPALDIPIPPKLPTQPIRFRWSKLKHGIVRQFLAFDTDLQVWEEQDYADEAALATIGLYSGTLLGRLEKAKELLYGPPNEAATDSIARVVAEAKDDLPPEIAAAVASEWQRVTAVLPQAKAQNERVDSIISQLHSADKRDFRPLRNGMTQKGGFRFCDWNHDLADSLFRIEHLLLTRKSAPV